MSLDKQESPIPIVSNDKNIGIFESQNFSPNLSSHESTLDGNNMHTISSEGSGAYAEHGPGIDHKIPQELEIQSKPDLLWSRVRHTMREPFSEFFGVFILWEPNIHNLILACFIMTDIKIGSCLEMV